MGKTLENVFEDKGGRAVIFTSAHKEENNSFVKYESKEKIPTFKPKVDTFSKLGYSLAKKCVTVDLFITSERDFEL